MKTIKNITFLLLLIVVTISAGCKKDQVMYGKGFESFKFVVKEANKPDQEYPGVITGDEIVVQLPTEVDVTNLKASFTIDNPRTIVQVGTEVQESGITEKDFTNPVSYNVKAEDKSRRNYSVRIEKKIAIKSFGFYAEDNPGLLADYDGIIKGLNINIPVPETVNINTLIARFETTAGVVLKVGSVTQENRKTANNFTDPVLYTLTEASLAAPFDFTVSISFIGRQWVLIGDNLTVPTAFGIKMAINPINNYPYFIYQRIGKDEDGIAIINDKKKVAVMGYNGTDWKNIGPSTGISEFRADVPGIAFDQEGTPFVAYKDYMNNEQKATVLKYNGASWTVVGSSRFTPIKVDYLSLAMTANDTPIISMAKNGTDQSGVPARGLYTMNYVNSTWSNITPPGGIPIFYNQIIRGLDNKIYIGLMDRSTGTNKPSLYVNNNNVWSAVGPTSFTAPDLMVGFQMVSVAVDKTGQAYLAYGVAPSSGRLVHVMKFNKSISAWQELGAPAPVGSEKDKFAIATDSDGTLYFAYATSSSVIVKTFNSSTNNWNSERRVIKEKVNEFDMQIALDGTVYIVASITSNSRTAVYKYAK
ncbi:hypothetical protein [Pedobacter nyackensis]|uniref:DUF5018 domain-containing protein n=1 Tax=Pedobacter nyackensis TaxID=475255 RepID=A0A1W2BA94_9SPHI|nr:hypothetical protein [Pedobacter nyackensis]SMC69700.1 hypothetical protein SAMN04488101_102238 [Pedobacter nyackensis]